MFICKTCGKVYDAPTNFCSACGGNQIEEQMAEPVYNAAPYQAAPAPAPTPGVSFFGNTALLGAIVSFASAFIAFLAMIFTFVSFDENSFGFASAVISLFSTVLSILGLSLIKKEDTVIPLAKVGIMISFISAMAGAGFSVLSLFAYMGYAF